MLKYKSRPPQAMSERSPAKSRTRNPSQTRAKLLQATIDLVAEKGADALSLKEAARIAKVSRGVAYQHFEDRDHLLREAKAWLSERLLESVTGELDPDSTEDRVHRVAKLILNNREASRVLLADALAGKDFRADQPLHRLLLGALEHFTASGQARDDMDLEVLSFILLGSVASIIMLSYQHDGDIDSLAERFTTEWTRILRKGIFVSDSDKPRSSSENKPSHRRLS